MASAIIGVRAKDIREREEQEDHNIPEYNGA
jgi:hypothetical protein